MIDHILGLAKVTDKRVTGRADEDGRRRTGGLSAADTKTALSSGLRLVAVRTCRQAALGFRGSQPIHIRSAGSASRPVISLQRSRDPS